jgi:hypothetical protein
MKFMLLIMASHRDWTQAPQEEVQPLLDDHQSFLDDLRDADMFVTGWGLYPVTQSKTVRVDEGEPVVSDGPFAETKEQVGGFYLIEAESQAQALEWAARLAEFNESSVEVRPVIEDPRWPK